MTRRSRRRAMTDGGQVGGVEGLVFGVLVFVLGTLVVANAWGVVDAKLAATAAAREATRAFVEASSPDDAPHAARRAGLDAFVGHGRSPGRASIVRLAGELVRCARVTYEAAYRVPLVLVPVIGGLGRGFTVAARHSEVVDPYRTGLGNRGAGCGAR